MHSQRKKNLFAENWARYCCCMALVRQKGASYSIKSSFSKNKVEFKFKHTFVENGKIIAMIDMMSALKIC